MTVTVSKDSRIGVILANRLGLKTNKSEGHDLAGPCIACNSSDAFRLHQKTGVAQCYSCGDKWSPFQVAEQVLGDREQAKQLLVELGIFRPTNDAVSKPVNSAPPDPIGVIANQKAIPRDSLVVYGAKAKSPSIIQMPAYGPDGKQCTTFCLSSKGGKGLFAKGKPAGLFFLHNNGQVRLPQPGETWYLCEGLKDAAALHALGYLVCGLNTCRLVVKFARLFRGTNVILIPDRDRAGEEGSQYSASVLRGVANLIRVAVLPAEFKESDGADVRDILCQRGGQQMVRQAIDDAASVESVQRRNSDNSHGSVSTAIEMPVGDPVTLTVFPSDRKSRRVIMAKRGNVSQRDQVNTDSSISRDRFIRQLAAKLDFDVGTIEALFDPRLIELADQADEQFAELAGDDRGEQESQATIAANMVAKHRADNYCLLLGSAM